MKKQNSLQIDDSEDIEMIKNIMISIKNKIIVITGTSRGIGFDLCKKFLPLKCKVIGFSRKKVKYLTRIFITL